MKNRSSHCAHIADQLHFGRITDNSDVTRLRKGCRQGLSRWRGGRYRVVNQESSGTTDIVWVIGKGDSCDPFTQDDAGGTPASRLFCHHHTQLLAGGDRVRQVFRQVSRQARPQRTSNLSSLSADRAQTDARHGGQPGSGASVLFRPDATPASVSRVLTVP